jgi:ABC-type molybdenum transport system ATPase subunit/photorepair protein PhrA
MPSQKPTNLSSGQFAKISNHEKRRVLFARALERAPPDVIVGASLSMDAPHSVHSAMPPA